MTPDPLVAPVVGGTPELKREIENAHRALDEIGAPREDGYGRLTLTGRCWALSNRYAEELAALVPRPEPREPEPQWLPIETAPKDGRWFWVKRENSPSTAPNESVFKWDESHRMWFAGTGWWTSWPMRFTHWRLLNDAAVRPASAPSLEPHMKLSLHRCKICGTRWLLWPDIHGDGWNLLDKYSKPGACCDNVPMGEQIEHLRDFDLVASAPSRPLEDEIRQVIKRLKDELGHISPDIQATWTYENPYTSAHATLRDCLSVIQRLRLLVPVGDPQEP